MQVKITPSVWPNYFAVDCNAHEISVYLDDSQGYLNRFTDYGYELKARCAELFGEETNDRWTFRAWTFTYQFFFRDPKDAVQFRLTL